MKRLCQLLGFFLPVFGMASVNPEVPPNIASEAVNEFLLDAKACHFFAADSNSVVDGLIKPGPRVRVVENSSQLLAACRDVQSHLGGRACNAIEFAGHAHRQSLALEYIVGVDLRPGSVSVYPSNRRLFRAVIQCLHDIAAPGYPLIFSTCGGIHLDDGSLVPNPNKVLAHKVFTEASQFRVVSPLGPCRANGGETECDEGWYESYPESPLGK